MQKVLILGAGKIGALISGFLAECRDYEVHVADVNGNAANSVVAAHGLPNLHAYELDASNPALLEAHLREHPADTIISSLPFYCNVKVAEIARKVNAHYFDLTEDVAVTRSVRKTAEGSTRAFVPQCGLAPGFISIAANALIQHFDEIRSVKLRVGALPQHPNNALKYSLTWSTDGLINEYGNPCEALVDGRAVEVAPLEGLEEIEIDGMIYEAFNTSGGLGSPGRDLRREGADDGLQDHPLPGHCAQMRLLMNDLKLNFDRSTLKRVLENAVPQTLQDVVIVYVAVAGRQHGELREENYVSKIYPQVIAGRLWSAIQVTRPPASAPWSTRDATPLPASCARKTSAWSTCSTTASAALCRRRGKDLLAHGGRHDRTAQRCPEPAMTWLLKTGLTQIMPAPGRVWAAGDRCTADRVINPTTGACSPRAGHDPGAVRAGDGVGRGRREALAQRAGTEARRGRAPAGRGAAAAQVGARQPGPEMARSSPRARRSAGDDRHRRLRGRPVAHALRRADALGASQSPHVRAVAPARRGRRDQRLQLPGRRVVVERVPGAICGNVPWEASPKTALCAVPCSTCATACWSGTGCRRFSSVHRRGTNGDPLRRRPARRPGVVYRFDDRWS
jgi:saccharopine dehydrogenase-like NADP-dependent oxidoreductase